MSVMQGPMLAGEMITPLLDGVLGVIQRETRRKLHAIRPEVWARDVLGVILWSKQIEVCHSIVEHKNTMVAAGHGVGKSFLTAVLACWWIDTHEVEDATVLSTAPSTSQVRNIIWRTIQKMHLLSRKRHEEYKIALKKGRSTAGLPDHALPGRVTSSATWKSDTGVPIGFGRTPPRGREGDTFQGIHGNVFAIADEAVGCSEAMIDTLANNTSNESDRRLLIANPTNPQSYMGLVWHDPIKSKAWNKITISVLDSPKFTNEHESLPPEAIKDLVDQTYVDDKKLEYGEESANYKARVLGMWATESGMIVFPQEVIDMALETTVIPDEGDPVYFGFDVARSEKGDFSYVFEAQEGWIYQTHDWLPDEDAGFNMVKLPKPIKTDRRGLRVRYVDSWRGLPFFHLYNTAGQRTSEDAANVRVHSLAQERGVVQVRIDSDGMGSQMVDAMYMPEVVSDDYDIIEMSSNDPSPNKNAWYNNRAFQFMNLARRMRLGEIDLIKDGEHEEHHRKLIEQLIAIEYKFAQGYAESILIESKKSMRDRGVKSPDAADAVWYATADISHLMTDALPVGTRVEADLDDYELIGSNSGFFAMDFGAFG